MGKTDPTTFPPFEKKSLGFHNTMNTTSSATLRGYNL